jgi:copper(I)-binding protein
VKTRAVLPLLAAVAILSACSVSQGAVTASSDQIPSIQGVGATTGHVTVDNALVLFPPRLRYAAGSDAPLSLVLTNGARTDDRLVSAQSTVARAVEIAPAVAGTTPPTLGCTRSPYRPAPVAEPLTRISSRIAQPLPNGGMVVMTPNCPHLVLVGLKRDLTVVDTVPLRLTLANARTVDLVLPVQTARG